jgi:transcriptional regulator with XRE-family HTH domain
MKEIWKKMGRKAYRDAFVSAHVSNTVASQIAALRAAKGWTQTELAEHAGMKQSRISALEDPNYENIEVGTLRRLASAFDVAVTVRFIPFSDLAYWAATLSEDKLVVPKFDEDELGGQIPLPQPNAAASAMVAFTTPLQQFIPKRLAIEEAGEIRLTTLPQLARPTDQPTALAMASS